MRPVLKPKLLSTLQTAGEHAMGKIRVVATDPRKRSERWRDRVAWRHNQTYSCCGFVLAGERPRRGRERHGVKLVPGQRNIGQLPCWQDSHFVSLFVPEEFYLLLILQRIFTSKSLMVWDIWTRKLRGRVFIPVACG